MKGPGGGVPEYWLVNLLDRVLEVHCEPAPAPEAAYGWPYSAVTTFQPADIISPLAAPQSRIPVADLLS